MAAPQPGLADGVTSLAAIELVMSHLRHHGFKRTEGALARSLGRRSAFKSAAGGDARSEAIEWAAATRERRRELSSLIIDGNLGHALDFVEANFPGLAERRPDLMSRMRQQLFLELVRVGSLAEAIMAARSLLRMGALLKAGQEQAKYLEDMAGLFSIMGYADPQCSPKAHLLNPEHRLHLAHDVDLSLLGLHSMVPYSPLELCVRQVRLVNSAIEEEQAARARSMRYERTGPLLDDDLARLLHDPHLL